MTQLSLRMETSFPEIADGICHSDARGRILHLNPAAESILGVSSAEAEGTSLCALLCGRLSGPELSCSPAHCPLRLRRSSRTSATFKGRYSPRRRKTDIARDDVDLRVRCLRSSDGDLITLLEDITAQTSLERQKEDWRSMVAHDLRAPLTNFYSGLRAIQEDVTAPSPRLPDGWILDICLRNCRRMLEMLDLYLDVARFDAGLMPVELSRVELAALVRAGVEEQAFLAAERRAEVAIDVPPGLAAWADAPLLRRSFQNILNNALKFSPKNGRVDVSAGRDARGRVTLSVRDMGPGIAPEDIPVILDRYRQTGAHRRDGSSGVGLGLTFCRQALKAMGGELSIESRPGAGSCFTLHQRDVVEAAAAPRRPSRRRPHARG